MPRNNHNCKRQTDKETRQRRLKLRQSLAHLTTYYLVLTIWTHVISHLICNLIFNQKENFDIRNIVFALLLTKSSIKANMTYEDFVEITVETLSDKNETILTKDNTLKIVIAQFTTYVIYYYYSELYSKNQNF